VKSLALVAALAFGTVFALPTPARAAGLRGQLQISGSPASAGRNWH
jgi:hypothetical protein